MTLLIGVDEALGCLRRHSVNRRSETIALEHAHGRTLAEDLMARTTRPPSAHSAMDGYAVRLQDVGQPGARLRLIGEAPAGRPYQGHLEQGQAVRIFTGGEIPKGADHIIIQEDVTLESADILCPQAYDQARYIRPEGQDFREGDTLLKAGIRLGAAELSLAAAANHAHLPVLKKLRIGLLANGDELCAPGQALKPGQIINSNPPGLSALIRDWDGLPVDLGIATDQVSAIRERIQTASDIDLFLPIGGASVGDYDHMQTAFAEEGFTSVFSRIAVRPGKPCWFARRGAQRVLGLPGNPASALVCAYLFLSQLLLPRSGLTFSPARLSSPLAANGPRMHFMRAQARITSDGVLNVRPAADQDSGRLTPFRDANALIRRAPHAATAKIGDPVEIMIIRPLMA